MNGGNSDVSNVCMYQTCGTAHYCDEEPGFLSD